MKKLPFLCCTLIVVAMCGCKQQPEQANWKVRQMVDTVGFAQYKWQMDSVIQRMNYNIEEDNKWRVAISPHDDYAYVGDLYLKILKGIKAKTVILFGVAHKAKDFELEDKIIFDSYDAWMAPCSNVEVSGYRDKILAKLPDSLYTVHNEIHRVEHSLEALIAFIHYYNPELEIVPMLVPYMSYDKMQQIAKLLSKAIAKVIKKENLNWGDDLALVISTDAVHYGDQDWGGKNYAPYGTDSAGLVAVKNTEIEIINRCLIGEVSPEKIRNFIQYTVQESDYKEYKWTWCGRYSVPFGLLTAYHLNNKMGNSILKGDFIGYSTSIDHPKIKVEDLNMGTTAPANNHHFVGYAAVGYK